MGQLIHAGYMIVFQANNLPVMVTDDPLPAPLMLVMIRSEYNKIMREHPEAIQPEPVMINAQGRGLVPVNHTPITLGQDLRFPPDAGKWMRTVDGDIIIGCPGCVAVVSIKAPPFSVRPDGHLLPSYVCEKCKLHCMLTLDNIRPDPDKCTTCGHAAHTSPCATPKGGKPCGCADGTGWQPQPVVEMPPPERTN
jgi:hypothetical protein